MSELASESMSQRRSEAPTSNPSRTDRYRPPASRWWWVRRRSYLLFVLRELSSLFVAWFVVYLLLLVNAVRGGNNSYREFLAVSGQPWMLALNVVALAFVLLHAITWFNLAPQAIVVRMGGRRLPARAVAAAHFAAWAVLSAIIAWILVGTR
jgi:fumarate reductase subunit C